MAKKPTFTPAPNPWAGMTARLKKAKKPTGKKGTKGKKGASFGS